MEAILDHLLASAIPNRPISPVRESIAIIVNPTAGGMRPGRFARALARFEAAGWAVSVHPTTRRGGGEELAQRLAAGPLPDAVIAAGGDGTIAEVVNGLAGSPVALGVLPFGTANVLAHEIGLGGDPVAAADALIDAVPIRVHLGRCNGRLFTMMCGIGFDAHVVARVSPALKRRLGQVRLGKLSYVMASLTQAACHRPVRYRLTIDGREVDAGSAVVANGHYYAGRFVLAPDARLERAEFQVCLFERGGRVDALRYGAAMLAGLVPRLPDVSLITARRIEIDGPAGDPVQADGDLASRLPAAVDLVPDALTLLVPPRPAG